MRGASIGQTLSLTLAAVVSLAVVVMGETRMEVAQLLDTTIHARQESFAIAECPVNEFIRL